MRTAEDDSVPVPHDALRLPRAVLNWNRPPPRGIVWRPQRAELEPEDADVSPLDSLAGAHTSSRAAIDEDDEPTRTIPPDDEPTRALQVPIVSRTAEPADALQVLLARGAVHLDTALGQAAKLWRVGPLRSAAMMAGAALITYLALGGARRGNDDRAQVVLIPAAVPAAPLPLAAPIIVEQLNGARQPAEAVAAPLHGEQSDRPGRRSASSRARVTSFAATPSSTSNGSPLIAPARSKPQSSRAEPSGVTVSSSSAGLPAWGADAVRDFSGGKSSAGPSVTSHAHELTAKPTSSNADIPPPVAASASSAREEAQAAPVVAAKPAEAAAPPPPSKPLTMEQVLNQVEEAAQAQRKQAGLKAPKTSKRDAELDELINGAMKSKTK